MKTGLLATLFLLIFTTVVYAAGATYWVDGVNGSDSNGCTNTTTPQTTGAKRTVTNAVVNCMSNSDTLQIRQGNYAERPGPDGIRIPSGTALNHTVVRAYGNEYAWFDTWPFNVYDGTAEYIDFIGGCTTGINRTCQLTFDGTQYIGVNDGADGIAMGNFRGQYITFDGIRVTGFPNNGFSGGGFGSPTEAAANPHVEMKNCRVDHNGYPSDPLNGLYGYGFYIGSHDLRVHDCEIDTNGGYGIHQYSSNIPGMPNWWYNNLIHDNGSSPADAWSNVCAALFHDSGTVGNKFFNNVIWGQNPVHNGGGAICVGWSPNTVIANNTIYGASGANAYRQTGIDISSTASAAFVENNIIYNFNNYIEDIGSGSIFSGNLCGFLDTGCTFSGDPLFVDPNNTIPDFRVCVAAGNPVGCTTGPSPAIDNGVDASAIMGCTSGVDCKDIAGNIRPQ